ncbi:cilia- and flagella-associated protein 68-like [Liolophura sinensis]|uniref:cilia- and flagella-associated protein 68-like n=1 Tax=Liolophura sinensis TaxID=3198878 RepID=UPI0031594F64
MSVDKEPAFRSTVRASGLGEVWTHSNDDSKFRQFGWRCTTNESSFCNGTLVGNWNEEKFDTNEVRKAERLPSQYDHYYERTYGVSYNTVPREVPTDLKHLKAPYPHAFPGHQPELDSRAMKAVYNSWQTTNRMDYIHPDVRRAPVQTKTATVSPSQTS